MNAIDFIKQELEASKGWAMGLIMDMRETPTVQPTPNGGNHPLWVLGHLVYSESSLLDEFVLGQPNRFAEWQPLFGMGSTPTDDPSKYPSFDEIAQKFEEMRAATLAHLDTLSDQDLSNKTHAPEEFGPMFGTVAGCYGAMGRHVAFHAGQVADCRRAAGKDPLMA